MSKQKRQHEQPNFQPIAMLPTLTMVIDGQLAETEEQYKSLLAVKDRPHVLDDATVDRVIQVYTDGQEYDGIYEEQLARWREERLTDDQRREVERLAKNVARLRELHRDILALAAELKRGTIDQIMAMSDEEVGLAMLTGKLKHPEQF